jgi:hypothetical protein
MLKGVVGLVTILFVAARYISIALLGRDARRPPINART